MRRRKYRLRSRNDIMGFLMVSMHGKGYGWSYWLDGHMIYTSDLHVKMLQRQRNCATTEVFFHFITI